MKKILSTLVVLATLLTLCCGVALAAEEQNLSLTMQIDNPVMRVNGVEKDIDPGRGTTPAIVNGRTLVPIRAIVEEMGGTVRWEEENQTTVLTYADKEIKLTTNETTAYVNDTAFTLDTAPAVLNARTMLPIRFIAEQFQFTVSWQQSEQTITIAKGPEAVIPPEQERSENKALTVYFSATGNTRTLAEKVAQAAGADLCEILPAVAYTAEDLNYNNDNSRANREMEGGIRPDIQALSADIASYDVILLGYPIWWGDCPAVVQTFLAGNDLSVKTIMPFCTSGSSGINGSLATIRQLAPNSTVTEGFRGTAATTTGQINDWLTQAQ